MASTAGAGSVAASLLGKNSGATSTPLMTSNVMSGIKNLPGGVASNQMRPRANTISHMEPPSMFMEDATHSFIRGMPPGVHSRHPSLAGLPMHGLEHLSFQSQPFTGVSSALDHGMGHDLLKLDTSSLDNHDFSGGLRTAPIQHIFSPDFDFDSPSFGHNSGSTINPNALHYDDSTQGPSLDSSSGLDRSGDQFGWLAAFGNQLPYGSVIEENAVDGSSPSAVSTGSQSGISDVMLDGSTYLSNMQTVTVAPPASSTESHTMSTASYMWNPALLHQPLPQNNFSLDLGTSSFSDLLSGLPVSPGAPPHAER
ncbi:hypothetical protein SEPCBS119000_001829 [Sporothrix epigloea]|uniref:Uncharacterized protein n=1 Tax=Sporothrix epigloea TaxID=1892477 RepID=A0ABP0DCV8_9PEZI